MSIAVNFFVTEHIEPSAGLFQVRLHPVDPALDPPLDPLADPSRRGAHPNRAVWEGRPAGEVTLLITIPAAAAYFQPGACYRLTFDRLAA